MKTFDIDSVLPKILLEDIERHKQFCVQYAGKSHAASKKHMSSPGYERVGFKTEDIIDWRRLEKRHNELDRAWSHWNDLFWSTMGDLFERGKERARADNKKCAELYVIDENDSEKVIVYTPKSYMHLWPSWTVKSMKYIMQDKLRLKPDDCVVNASVEDAAKIWRMRERSDVFRRRAEMYCRAWRFSVQSRFQTFIDENLKVDDRHTIVVFSIENEGRTHTCLSHGMYNFEWMNIEIFASNKPA